MQSFSEAYDEAVNLATGDDVRVGSTTTRISDFVNRGAAFDGIYVYPRLLEACCQVIGGPFKLSSLLARTVRAHQPAQGLHIDVQAGSADWPLFGFILMVDEFRPDNGATRFVPGSHRQAGPPNGVSADPAANHPEQVLACGPAGSLLIFNGSTWHGHTANSSDQPRRSLQGFFVPRSGHAATDFGVRMLPETRRRLSSLAKYLLAIGDGDLAV
jgi:ectoine hydroxylase-related dioxygenase (phytanoyl-CoA dioxygenase family)